MGGILGDTVDEARHLLHQIVRELANQSSSLHDIANKPPEGVRLTKLDVLSAPELRNFKLGENLSKMLINPREGSYTRIDHWAWMCAVAAKSELFAGPVGKENLTLVQCLEDAALIAIDGNSDEKSAASFNPQELVIPPEFAVYGVVSKPGELSLSTIRYQLTV